jgi:hypothetical protein
MLVPCALTGSGAGELCVRPPKNERQAMPTVFLAISPAGLKEAIQLASSTGSAIWCGSDAVSESEFQSLAGRSITRFIYPLEAEPTDVINGAVSTIEEHHPGSTVWVEQPKPEV